MSVSEKNPAYLKAEKKKREEDKNGIILKKTKRTGL